MRKKAAVRESPSTMPASSSSIGTPATNPRSIQIVNGRIAAFFRITFPLLAPGLVAAGVYGFLQAWNEYTLALVVMTDPAQRTLPLWLQGLVESNRATDWGVVMAGSALIAIPVIVFFLFVQNKMTSGLVAGAVKG